MVSPFRAKIAPDSPRVMRENPMSFMELGVVARGGIEPPTRGFSVRRRARFGASKPKTGNGFSVADRTAPPDRAYPELDGRRTPDPAASPMPVNGLLASGPNLFRTRRTHQIVRNDPSRPRPEMTACQATPT